VPPGCAVVKVTGALVAQKGPAAVIEASASAFTVMVSVSTPPQPPGIVYVIVFAPTAPIEGSKTPVAAFIHAPQVALQVPPASTAVNVTGPLLWQTAG
jgi:hypothetical protein